jgi:hypothetical protein
MRPVTRQHQTSVGTVVEVKYERVDDEHVRILRYRRRKPGRANFRRDPSEEGRIVLLSQLPWGGEA